MSGKHNECNCFPLSLKNKICFATIVVIGDQQDLAYIVMSAFDIIPGLFWVIVVIRNQQDLDYIVMFAFDIIPGLFRVIVVIRDQQDLAYIAT